MSTTATPRPAQDRPSAASQSARAGSKKARILALHDGGEADLGVIAERTGARLSYVASVLQQSGRIRGYFDLYTSTGKQMNAYSRFFTGQLGFKTVESASESVQLIDRMHRRFERSGDRAGQHHALTMAMTMYNRARWSGKDAEAEVFRVWLAAQIAPSRRPQENAAMRAVELPPKDEAAAGTQGELYPPLRRVA